VGKRPIKPFWKNSKAPGFKHQVIATFDKNTSELNVTLNFEDYNLAEGILIDALAQIYRNKNDEKRNSQRIIKPVTQLIIPGA